MGLPDVDTVLGWRGRTVRDSSGEELGTIAEIYLDSDDRPAWASVKRGRFRASETLVPLDQAHDADGELHLPFDRERFDAAPDVDPDVALEPDEERLLHEHYGREWAPPSGTETDDAMTRSEEEVEMTTRPVKRAERVRLKKVLVDDEVTKTVPVKREVIALETDPPPGGEPVDD